MFTLHNQRSTSLQVVNEKSRIRPLLSPKPLNPFWWNVALLILFGTPPCGTTSVRVGLRRWSWHVTWHFAVCLFSFFFRRALWLHILTDLDNLYTKTHVFSQGLKDVSFRGLIWLSLRVKLPQKIFPKWAGIVVFKPKWRKWKLDISRKLLNSLMRNFLGFFQPSICGDVDGLAAL